MVEEYDIEDEKRRAKEKTVETAKHSRKKVKDESKLVKKKKVKKRKKKALKGPGRLTL